MIRRREYMALIGGVVVVWPLAAWGAAAGDAGDWISARRVA